MAQRMVKDTKEMAWIAMPARKILEPISAVERVLEMVRPPPAAWMRKVATGGQYSAVQYSTVQFNTTRLRGTGSMTKAGKMRREKGVKRRSIEEETYRQR
jgi:hypothetical protein